MLHDTIRLPSYQSLTATSRRGFGFLIFEIQILIINAIEFGSVHVGPHRLKVITKFLLFQSRLSLDARPVLSNHAKALLSCHSEIPVGTCLLEVLDSILKLSLLFDQSLHLDQRVLSSALLNHCQSLPEVLILLLQLEDLCVAVIKYLALSLNSLPETQVTLQNFFHHVDCMHNPLSDSVL